MPQTALPSPLFELLEIHRDPVSAAELPERRANYSTRLRLEERVHREPSGLGGMLGRAPAMLELFRRIEKASQSHSPVLIEGAPGVGKRLTACTLHAMGGSAGGPFVAIDGASLEGRPGNLLSTLLTQGQERGGTLFIDEVADLPAEAQRDLWRLLETARRRPAGLLLRPMMRIVCSTSRDLRAEVERGALRDDLYARLRSFVLPVPSLRERRDDLLLLIEHFLAELSQVYGKQIPGLSPVALDLFLAHNWEGNVRELRSELERAVLLTAEGAEVEPAALSPDLLPVGMPSAGSLSTSLKQRSRALERKMLADALAKHRWNVAATARELGISRVGLSKKLRSLDLKRPPRTPKP